MPGFSKTALAGVLATLATLAPTALAHGTVPGITTGGTYTTGFLLDFYYMRANGQTPPATPGWYAENLDNGFVDGTSYTSPDIICHRNAAPATASASVAAGDSVSFHWTAWPDSHMGPILTYVARCDGDCANADKAALAWVKIDEAAIDLATQEWPTKAMIANNNTYTVTVPASLAPGNYVFRHEIIAMHAAGSQNGAQNYPQCLNIAITGSGTDTPAGTVGTKLYTPTDPGILFNPYGTLTEYVIPGPALYTGGSSSGGSGSGSGSSPAPTNAPAATSATATSVAVSTPVATPTTAVPSTPSTPSTPNDECPADDEDPDEEEEDDGSCPDVEPTTATAIATAPAPSLTAVPTTLVTSTRPAAAVPVYGRCGGTGYTGSTTCAAGSTCVVQNSYYSQCVPRHCGGSSV